MYVLIHTVFNADGNVYVWQCNTGRLLEVLRGHEESVGSVSWNPRNQQMIASRSDDKTIRVWEVNGFEELHSDTAMDPELHHSYSQVSAGKDTSEGKV